MKAKFKA